MPPYYLTAQLPNMLLGTDAIDDPDHALDPKATHEKKWRVFHQVDSQVVAENLLHLFKYGQPAPPADLEAPVGTVEGLKNLPGWVGQPILGILDATELDLAQRVFCREQIEVLEEIESVGDWDPGIWAEGGLPHDKGTVLLMHLRDQAQQWEPLVRDELDVTRGKAKGFYLWWTWGSCFPEEPTTDLNERFYFYRVATEKVAARLRNAFGRQFGDEIRFGYTASEALDIDETVRANNTIAQYRKGEVTGEDARLFTDARQWEYCLPTYLGSEPPPQEAADGDTTQGQRGSTAAKAKGAYLWFTWGTLMPLGGGSDINERVHFHKTESEDLAARLTGMFQENQGDKLWFGYTLMDEMDASQSILAEESIARYQKGEVIGDDSDFFVMATRWESQLRERLGLGTKVGETAAPITSREQNGTMAPKSMPEQDYFLIAYRNFEVHDVVVGEEDVDVLVVGGDSCTFYKVDRSDIGQELLDLFRQVYGQGYPLDPFHGVSDIGQELLDLFSQAYGEPSYYDGKSVKICLDFELRAENTLTTTGAILYAEEAQKAKNECEKAYSWTDAPRWPDGPEGIQARLYDRAERWERLVRQRMARQDGAGGGSGGKPSTDGGAGPGDEPVVAGKAVGMGPGTRAQALYAVRDPSLRPRQAQWLLETIDRVLEFVHVHLKQFLSDGGCSEFETLGTNMNQLAITLDLTTPDMPVYYSYRAEPMFGCLGTIGNPTWPGYFPSKGKKSGFFVDPSKEWLTRIHTLRDKAKAIATGASDGEAPHEPASDSPEPRREPLPKKENEGDAHFDEEMREYDREKWSEIEAAFHEGRLSPVHVNQAGNYWQVGPKNYAVARLDGYPTEEEVASRLVLSLSVLTSAAEARGLNSYKIAEADGVVAKYAKQALRILSAQNREMDALATTVVLGKYAAGQGPSSDEREVFKKGYEEFCRLMCQVGDEIRKLSLAEIDSSGEEAERSPQEGEDSKSKGGEKAKPPRRVAIPAEVMKRLREIPARSEKDRRVKVAVWTYRNRTSEEIARHVETETGKKLSDSRIRQIRGEVTKWVTQGPPQPLSPEQERKVCTIMGRLRKIYRDIPDPHWQQIQEDLKSEVTTELLTTDSPKEAERAGKRFLDERRRDVNRQDTTINPDTMRPYDDDDA